MVWPYVVVLSSWKVTATEVALAQDVVVLEALLAVVLVLVEAAALEDVVMLTLQMPLPPRSAVG